MFVSCMFNIHIQYGCSKYPSNINKNGSSVNNYYCILSEHNQLLSHAITTYINNASNESIQTRWTTKRGNVWLIQCWGIEFYPAGFLGCWNHPVWGSHFQLIYHPLKPCFQGWAWLDKRSTVSVGIRCHSIFDGINKTGFWNNSNWSKIATGFLIFGWSVGTHCDTKNPGTLKVGNSIGNFHQFQKRNKCPLINQHSPWKSHLSW